ncbi:MAG: TRAP transporter small permease [Rhizobiaceae bacterium]
MRWLDRIEEILISSLIAAATTIIFIAVLHRYSISLSAAAIHWGRTHESPGVLAAGKAVFSVLRQINLTWAQELTIYMFVWMAKFGAAYGVRTGIHVGVDVLIERMTPARAKPFILFGLLSGAVFTAIVGTLGAAFVWEIAHTDQTSPDMEMPMWLIYLAVPLGSALMCFRFLQVAASFYRTGELPHHDHGHVEGIEETPA